MAPYSAKFQILLLPPSTTAHHFSVYAGLSGPAGLGAKERNGRATVAGGFSGPRDTTLGPLCHRIAAARQGGAGP